MHDARNTTLDRPYEAYRPRMLAELGRLAGEGVSIAPHDGLDLVHGFFLDEWPRTYGTYRAAEGDPWPYVRTAFRRYVRHEARREARSRYFDGPDPHPAAAEPDAPDPYDLARVGAALRSLPPAQSDALRTYLATASERATARRLGLSRAHARALLEAATAHVAAAVEPPPVRARARREPLATHPGADHAQRRGRLAAPGSPHLLQALREALPTPTPHAPTPVHAGTPMTAADLLRPYLTGAPPPEDRDALRHNAAVVLDALDAGDPAAVAVLDQEGAPEGYRALYADLAAALEPEIGADPLDATTPQDDLDEEAQIGHLFFALAEAHPQNGSSLRMTLGGLPEVDPETHERVYYSTPAVAMAGAKGAFLASRGLTPMTFFQAADAVGDLAERLAEEGLSSVCLAADGTLQDTDEPESLFVDEVSYVTGLDEHGARLVLTWLLAVAGAGAPDVFTGTRARDCMTGSVELRPDPVLLDLSLEERWDAVSTTG